MHYDLDIAPDERGQVVLAVVSDTHGELNDRTLATLKSMKPQLIVHAGDICSQDIIPALESIARVVAVLGNNDRRGAYGPDVTSTADFDIMGVKFVVTHRPEHLQLGNADISICGHTHVPNVMKIGKAFVVNPGSVSKPESDEGLTMARIVISKDCEPSIEIVQVK